MSIKPSKKQRASAQATMGYEAKAHLGVTTNRADLKALPDYYREKWTKGDTHFILRGRVPGTQGPQMEMHTVDFTYISNIGKTGIVGMPMYEVAS